ncbi:IS66 family transposase, partial [Roseomonas sp. M0104]|nr:IS66 family transposase [Pseudoroseomonas coralli]
MEITFAQPEDEIAALRQLLAERDGVIAEQAAALAERDAQLVTSALEIEHLRVQLAALRRQQYGQSSERLAADIAQLELRLEDLEESQAEQAAAHEARQDRAVRRRQPAVRKPLPAHLPRQEIVHEPATVCGCCPRKALARLGEDVTEVLEKVPARLQVIRHVRPRYACRICEGVFQAPAPDLPIERGRPGPGLLAHVAVSKYCDGLPLYRQAAILAREGVEIERAVLADWMGHVAWWLAPIAARIGTHVMAQPVLWTDDTTTRVLAPGTGKTRQARFWVYAIDPRPYAGQGPPAAFYRYSPDRRGERPRDHLAGFRGYLQADAYSGYEALYRPDGMVPARITQVACWAHARRGSVASFVVR